MSTQAVQMAMGLIKTGDYDRGNLKVLMYLSTKHNWRSGTAWPAEPTIACETGLSERTVRRCLAYLEAQGVIRHIPGNGRNNFSRYEFPLLDEISKQQKISFEKEDIRVPLSKIKEDTVDDKGGHREPERRTPEPVKEDTAGSAIRKEKESKELQNKNQKATPLNFSIETQNQLQTSDPWEAISARLRQTMNHHSWDCWIRPAKFSHVDSGILFALVPHLDFCYGDEKYRGEILAVIDELNLDLTGVRFVTFAGLSARCPEKIEPTSERSLELVKVSVR
jgi:hypothetical protein